MASIGVDDGGEAVASARDGVQIHEGGFIRGHCIAEGHSGSGPLVQTENVLEVRGHVLEEGEFARTGIAENAIHAEVAQDLVGCLSDCGHVCTLLRGEIHRECTSANIPHGEGKAEKFCFRAAIS